MEDIVTDGTFLWIAVDPGEILKVTAADRVLQQTWHINGGQNAAKLGVFAGRVWIADFNGNLYQFNPSDTPGTIGPLFTGAVAVGRPTLAFDGTNVWLGSAGGVNLFTYQVSASTGTAIGPFGGNMFGFAFDGTFMWMLLSNGHLQKLNIVPGGIPTIAEDIALPVAVNDCRMAWDGNDLWIPSGVGNVLVVRPAQGSFPSSVVLNQPIAGASFPYVASFDGENIMIGDVNDGLVSLWKATSLTGIRSFNSGAAGVRGIASDGLTFNVGDATGTKLFQL